MNAATQAFHTVYVVLTTPMLLPWFLNAQASSLGNGRAEQYWGAEVPKEKGEKI